MWALQIGGRGTNCSLEVSVLVSGSHRKTYDPVAAAAAFRAKKIAAAIARGESISFSSSSPFDAEAGLGWDVASPTTSSATANDATDSDAQSQQPASEELAERTVTKGTSLFPRPRELP